MFFRLFYFVALLWFAAYPAEADTATLPSCSTNADCKQYPGTICRVKNACPGEGPCDNSRFCIITPQEDWPNCKVDSDCVIVGSGCSFASVNTLYKMEANQYYSELNTQMNCATASSSLPSSIRIKPKAAHAICQTGKGACKKYDGSIDINSTCAVKSCVITQ